jgi:hypothetical protein
MPVELKMMARPDYAGRLQRSVDEQALRGAQATAVKQSKLAALRPIALGSTPFAESAREEIARTDVGEADEIHKFLRSAAEEDRNAFDRTVKTQGTLALGVLRSAQPQAALQEALALATQGGFDVTNIGTEWNEKTQRQLTALVNRAELGDKLLLSTAKGKGLEDRNLWVNQFGADSPEVEALDAAALLDPERDFKNSAVLRKEFIQGSKVFIDVRDAYVRIQKAATNPSAAGDMALIFNFMKMLDPGSTVREGEFATVANSGSVSQNMRAFYNKVWSGQRLSDAHRKDFTTRAQMLFSGQADGQKRHEQTYTGLSNRNRIRPEDVAIDYFGEDLRNVGSVDPSTRSRAEDITAGTNLDGTPITGGTGDVAILDFRNGKLEAVNELGGDWLAQNKQGQDAE